MEKENTFDAIVVGSGMSGGWAAKELTEKGLKTLVLERGREVKHLEDYTTTFKTPWDYKERKYDTLKTKEEYHIQSKKYNFHAGSKQFYVNDKEHPYTTGEDKPFRWFRGYQTGGRTLTWARNIYRFNDYVFEANKKDGVGIDWPIRYKDIEPWYDYVEEFIGVSGTVENIPNYPDGKYLPPFGMNVVEKELKKRIESSYPNRKLIQNRVAHLSKVKPGQFKGRSECQNRVLCETGCPFGAYFTSNSSTLPAAKDTGNLTMVSNAIVHQVIYDEKTNKAIGVKVIDSATKEKKEYYAKIIFLCASALATTSILLQSKNKKFPNGLANSSGVLGHYLMDQHKNIGGKGHIEGFDDRIEKGRKPASYVIPQFRNVDKHNVDFYGGYGFFMQTQRDKIDPTIIGIGKDLKDKISKPGKWIVDFFSQAECLPYEDNRVELDPEKKDQWGLPLLKITAAYKENEMKMRKDMAEQLEEMMQKIGVQDIKIDVGSHIMGDTTHEMGTARMGRNPKTSVLNAYNQCHDIPNLFITDGSCMTSSTYMSPSVTYMALTARAVDYAVKEMKKGNI